MRYYLWIKNKKNEIQPIYISNNKNTSKLFYDLEKITINNKEIWKMSAWDFYEALIESPNTHGLYIVDADAIWKDEYKKYHLNNKIKLLISSSLFKKYFSENNEINTFKANPKYFLRSKKIPTKTFLESVLFNSYKYSKKDNTELRNISFNSKILSDLNNMTSEEVRITQNKRERWDVSFDFYDKKTMINNVKKQFKILIK